MKLNKKIRLRESHQEILAWIIMIAIGILIVYAIKYI